MKAAALQLEPLIGDVAENLRRCELLADEAGAGGAEWIILPEFFPTGMAFLDKLADSALPPDGAALALLRRVALRHHATVGGSFICRDPDGHNRNAFLLVGPDGHILGRHDKDIPTMWENCFYVGGGDDGVIAAGEINAGAALCWEFMRTATAQRLRERVDVLVGGSAWWSIPPWPPAPMFRAWERRNATTAAKIAPAMARAIGAPVVHAAHCGTFECPLPLTPLTYRGRFQGGAAICDATGTTLARRDAADGPGVAIADIEVLGTPALDEIPRRFWLHRRGAVPALLWAYQNPHGRRWYRHNAFGCPPRGGQHLARPTSRAPNDPYPG